MNNRPYEISIWDDVLAYEVEYIVQSSEEEAASASAPGTSIDGSEYTIDMTQNMGVLSYEKNETGTQLVYNTVAQTTSKELVTDEYKVVDAKTKEKKIGIIGSSSMTAQHRALNGKLVENVNGSRTLTFSMYYKYYDNETGERVENPFTKLLTNERKVKLRLGNPGDADVEWYDFVIKDIQENSESMMFNYTCTDLFINELSKTGFTITLDAELENNIGKPNELAEYVLKGSGWKVGKGDLIHTFHEEPVYRFTLSSGSVQLRPVVASSYASTNYTLTASTNAPIELLVFYSSVNAEDATVQVLCPLDTSGEQPVTGIVKDDVWPLDETGIVVNSEHSMTPTVGQFLLDGMTYDEGVPKYNGATIVLTEKLRGRRIVRKQETKYDANLEKYVSRYSRKDDTTESPTPYWCFVDTSQNPITVLNNYVTNSNNFKDISGWEVLTTELPNELPISFISNYTSGLIDYDGSGEIINEDTGSLVTSWIQMDLSSGIPVGNTGLWDYLYDYDKISAGDVFILMTKYHAVTFNADQTVTYTNTTNIPTHSVRLYETKWSTNFVQFNCQKLSNTEIACIREFNNFDTKGWNFYKIVFNRDISHKELIEKDFRLTFAGNGTYYLNDAKLFKRILLRQTGEGQGTKVEPVFDESEANRYLLPGDYVDQPIVFPEYHVYENGASDGHDIETMTYLLSTKDVTILEQEYEPYYDPDSAARIQITAKESNRFNILQDIAENAECWVRFDIKHNAHTGKIETDDENKPIKTVTFYQFAGKKNFTGFKYGINLKSIQRTVDSNQLTSKLIVKPNSNEFAEAKQCAIGKAKNNPTKEDIIYNFDYYINHGMIPYKTWMDDMYGDESDDVIGYQKRMRKIVENLDEITAQFAYYSRLIDKLESECTVYKEALQSAVEERSKVLDGIYNYNSNFTYNDYKDLVKSSTLTIMEGEVEKEISSVEKDDQTIIPKPTTIQGLLNFIVNNQLILPKYSIESYFSHYVGKEMIKIDVLTERIVNYENVLGVNTGTGMLKDLESQKEKYFEIKDTLEKIKEQKTNLEDELYERYHRFVQEGTWISEDYYDNDLYYLEACNVSQVSAFPKTSYTINVIDISRVEGYGNVNFKVGEKSFIQDTEFFGWTTKEVDGTPHKTPYQEEVICSEVTRVFDDASQNTIRVQNYKNQFQDLFQRINATTQSVQYKSGEYQKAANAFTESGELKNNTLDAALERNTAILQNATNETVNMGSNGITTINLNQPNLMTRIVGGAVMVSNDGGITWGHAITGEGINANYLTAGTIDASTVNIRAGDGVAFGWNSTGLNAYQSEYINAAGAVIRDGNFDTSTFVRFDQFGIYGVKDNANFVPDGMEYDGITGENRIGLGNKNTPFGLTWNGFFFRTGEVGSGVVISSEDDIAVKQEEKNKVKIGRLEGGRYGIEVYDNKENAVISQDDSGNLSVTGSIVATNLTLKDGATIAGRIESGDGLIGGWYIGETALSSSEGGGATGMSSSSEVPAFWAGYSGTNYPSTTSELDSTTFYVTHDGVLYASGATITGSVITNGSINVNNNFIVDTSGNVTLNGNITWGTNSSPTQSLYAATGLSKPTKKYSEYDNTSTTDWHKIFTSGQDYFASYTYDGGASWTAAVQIVGQDGVDGKNGKDGIDGKDGTDATVNHENVFNALTNNGAIKGIVEENGQIYINATYIKSVGATIGGWKIGTTALTSEESSTSYGKVGMSSNTNQPAFWAGSDTNGGPAASHELDGTKFYVSHEGYLYSTSGRIGGWTIHPERLYSLTNGYGTGMAASSYTGGDEGDPAFWAGLSGSRDKPTPWDVSGWQDATNFYVTNKGYLHAKQAEIEGTLTASAGQIGNFTIDRTTKSLIIDNYPCYIILGGKDPTGSKNYAFTVRDSDIGRTNFEMFYDGTFVAYGSKIYTNQSDSSNKVYFSANENNNYITITSGSTAMQALFGRNYISLITTSGELRGSWTLNGSTIATTSDVNKKNSIDYLDDRYESFFDKLNARKFKYNDGTSDRFHTGYISQEVGSAMTLSNIDSKEFGGLVIANNPDGTEDWYLRYEEFISLNTWQIQKLKSRVSELEAKIAELEAKI